MTLRRSRPSTAGIVVVGVLAGAAASWVKALVEPPLQRLGEGLFAPAPGQKSLLGADVSGRPERMPPAVMIRRVSRSVTGREIGEKRSTEMMPVVHYGFGVAFGVAYTLLARRRPSVTMSSGLAAGAALWLATHGSIVPALRLQASPVEMPRAWWVWELGSHLVFGATLELGRRVALGGLPPTS